VLILMHRCSQGTLDGLASEDGCLDVCLYNMGQFHVQTLKVGPDLRPLQTSGLASRRSMARTSSMLHTCRHLARVCFLATATMSPT